MLLAAKKESSPQSSLLPMLSGEHNVWTISAIHGCDEKLSDVHDQLLEVFSPRDRVIYLGNYTGYSGSARRTLDEITTFRRLLLAQPGVFAGDMIYLRGQQEEMLSKLMQINFTARPEEALVWMLGNGLAATLHDYNIDLHDGIMACREGTLSLTRWLGRVRHVFLAHEGRAEFYTGLVHACCVKSAHSDARQIFVHTGYHQDHEFSEQSDHFWWSGELFDKQDGSAQKNLQLVRGYDPKHKGVDIQPHKATLDGGCGFGGSLVCTGFDCDGEIFEMFEC